MLKNLFMTQMEKFNCADKKIYKNNLTNRLVIICEISLLNRRQ